MVIPGRHHETKIFSLEAKQVNISNEKLFDFIASFLPQQRQKIYLNLWERHGYDNTSYMTKDIANPTEIKSIRHWNTSRGQSIAQLKGNYFQYHSSTFMSRSIFWICNFSFLLILFFFISYNNFVSFELYFIYFFYKYLLKFKVVSKSLLIIKNSLIFIQLLKLQNKLLKKSNKNSKSTITWLKMTL